MMLEGRHTFTASMTRWTLATRAFDTRPGCESSTQASEGRLTGGPEDSSVSGGSGEATCLKYSKTTFPPRLCPQTTSGLLPLHRAEEGQML